MENWNSNYNWTYEDFRRVVKTELEVRYNDIICLDVEHSDHGNINAMLQWGKDLGYRTELVEQSEVIKVYRALRPEDVV